MDYAISYIFEKPKMAYYFAKTLAISFDDAVRRVIDALTSQGFGVLTDIDVQGTLKAKIDIAFRRYRILGACNPTFAYRALQAEDKIGAMLPCNVVIHEPAGGDVEVAAVDPVASMQATNNSALASIAEELREKLRNVIAGL
ncbi:MULTISPECIES: DUF302 domain-containing protein [Caballeronia]|nr:MULTISPECIES: DUF302 domain-containing protein [Caballeronia]EKS71674.1 hypothetical protein BURK_007536 [Burkholderia sp. SJ98]